MRTLRDVLYINDSKGTNPDSTIKALEAYDRPVVIILGGKNKGSDFTQLAQLVKQRVKKAVVLGQAKPVIVEALKKQDLTIISRKILLKKPCLLQQAWQKPEIWCCCRQPVQAGICLKATKNGGRLFKQLVLAME